MQTQFPPVWKLATGLALACALSPLAATAAPASPLLAACAADQRDRDAHDRDPAAHDWTATAQRDRQRQDLAMGTLRAGGVRSFEDHRCAALILLHAGEEDRLRLAFAVATQGELLFGDRIELRKLAARAWDRLMMARRQPQWYATQFDAVAGNGFQLYPLAQGVMTEQERVARGGLSDAAVAAKLQQLNASATPPAPAAPPAAAKLRFRVTPALLKAALARDASLGSALAFFVRQGLALSPVDGVRQGRLIFLPRPADALAAYIDDPSMPFPTAPGSATPTSANGAVYRLEAAPGGGHRLVLGLDDAMQAAAQLVVTPSRWFELSVAESEEELILLAWRPLQATEGAALPGTGQSR